MTLNEIKQTQKLIKLLNQAQQIADRLELTIGNGGQVGSLIGTLADEIETRLEDQVLQ